MSIRQHQPFPDLGTGVSSFTFPASKTRYRVISVYCDFTSTGAPASRKLTLTQRVNDLVIAIFTGIGVGVGMPTHWIFSHSPTLNDIGNDAGNEIWCYVPIPFDMIIEPQHTLELGVIDATVNDAITNILLTSEIPNPKGKPIPGEDLP